MTQFLESLTIVQCRMIRDTILSTLAQRSAFNAAIIEVGALQPKEKTCEPSNSETPISPSHHDLAVAGAPASSNTVRVAGYYTTLFGPQCDERSWRMPTNAEFSDFDHFMTLFFRKKARLAESSSGVWSFDWARSHWVNPRWAPVVTEDNWVTVRAAWLKANGVLHVVLRAP
jgi:hypothetical protein